MPVSSTLNQVVQLGVETVAGQSPAGGSNRLLRHLTYNIDPDFQYQMYRGSGRRFNSVQTLKSEMAKYKVGGPISYTEIAYPVSGLCGLPVFTTPANGVLARQLAWNPKLSGAQGGVTYQGQNGDSTRTRQFNYMQQTGLELSFKRSGDSMVSGGDGFAQQTQQNSSFTASPTSQLQLPAPPINWNVYLDFASANIGVTQVAQCVEAQFKTSGWSAPIFFLNRANASFGAIVDTPPATTALLKVIPDAVVDTWWLAARANATAYVRFDAVGNPIDNQYTVALGAASAGNFTLSYKGITSGNISWNSTAAAMQTILQTAFGPTFTATGTTLPTGPVTVSIGGVNANDPSLVTANFAGITGGTPLLTNISVNNNLRIDLACKFVPQAYNDDGGGWVQDWLLEVVEDTAWTLAGAGGTAFYMQAISNMATL